MPFYVLVKLTLLYLISQCRGWTPLDPPPAMKVLPVLIFDAGRSKLFFFFFFLPDEVNFDIVGNRAQHQRGQINSYKSSNLSLSLSHTHTHTHTPLSLNFTRTSYQFAQKIY